MSARRRGLVRRGGALCVWDGERYVRVFSARRALHEAAIAGNVELLRKPFFDDQSGGMDAPDLLPGGGMRGCLGGVCFGVTAVIWREASK